MTLGQVDNTAMLTLSVLRTQIPAKPVSAVLATLDVLGVPQRTVELAPSALMSIWEKADGGHAKAGDPSGSYLFD